MNRSLSTRARVGLVVLVTASIAGIYVIPAIAGQVQRPTHSPLQRLWARVAHPLGVPSDVLDTVVVYGPKQAITPNGALTTTVEQFSVPQANQGDGYLLRIATGDAGGANRVTSGSVVLNGAEVASAAELAAIPNGGVIYKPVEVRADNNTIMAAVAGGAGAYVTLAVVGEEELRASWLHGRCDAPSFDPSQRGAFYLARKIVRAQAMGGEFDVRARSR
jgi:hypothetical protein